MPPPTCIGQYGSKRAYCMKCPYREACYDRAMYGGVSDVGY